MNGKTTSNKPIYYALLFALLLIIIVFWVYQQNQWMCYFLDPFETTQQEMYYFIDSLDPIGLIKFGIVMPFC